jgi:hypothetical protein
VSAVKLTSHESLADVERPFRSAQRRAHEMRRPGKKGRIISVTPCDRSPSGKIHMGQLAHFEFRVMCSAGAGTNRYVIVEIKDREPRKSNLVNNKKRPS